MCCAALPPTRHKRSAKIQQLDLQVRYFQDSTPLGVPCREENFVRRQIRMSLPLAQPALVLVDMWHAHFNDSWLERAAHLTGTAVVPVLEAARAAALKIIHAPSPEVAAGFPQLERHQPPLPEPVPQWPAADFRARQGDYAARAARVVRGSGRPHETGDRDV